MSLPASLPALLWSRERPRTRNVRFEFHAGRVLELHSHDGGELALRVDDARTGRVLLRHPVGRTVMESRWEMPPEPQVRLLALGPSTVGVVTYAGNQMFLHRIGLDGTVSIDVFEVHQRTVRVTGIEADGGGHYVASYYNAEDVQTVEIGSAIGGRLVQLVGRSCIALGSGMALLRSTTTRELYAYRGDVLAWQSNGAEGNLVVGDTIFSSNSDDWNEWAEETEETNERPPRVFYSARASHDGKQRWQIDVRPKRFPPTLCADEHAVALVADQQIQMIDRATGKLGRVFPAPTNLRLDGGRPLWSTETEIVLASPTGNPLWSLPVPGVGAHVLHVDGDLLACVHEHSVSVFGPR